MCEVPACGRQAKSGIETNVERRMLIEKCQVEPGTKYKVGIRTSKQFC